MDMLVLTRPEGGPAALRLPNELLIETFKYLQGLYDVADVDRHRFGTFPSLDRRLAVSRVCRRWRAVALSCPVLWCSIPSHNLDMSIRAMARSRTEPLSLFACFKDTLPGEIRADINTVVRCLQKGLSRMSRLYIAYAALEDQDRILSVLRSSAAPQLKEFTFITPDFIDIPNDIFLGERPPELTALCLDTVRHISLSSPFFSANLSSFELSVDFHPWRTIKELLDILGRLSCLRMLSLNHRSLDASVLEPGDVEPTLRIFLPSLYELHLQEFPDTLTFILRHIATPVLQKLKLIACARDVQEVHLKSSLEMLLLTCFPLAPFSYKCIAFNRVIAMADSFKASVTCSNTSSCVRKCGSEKYPDFINTYPDTFQLDIYGRYDEKHKVKNMVGHVASRLPIGMVEEVTIGDLTLPSDALAGILKNFGNFPRVKCLHLIGTATASQCALFWSPGVRVRFLRQIDCAENLQSRLFNLRHLRFSDVNFDGRLLDTIRDFVIHLFLYGTRSHISLSNCLFPEDRKDELEDLLGERYLTCEQRPRKYEYR